MAEKYIPPAPGELSFTCPSCEVLAGHDWQTAMERRHWPTGHTNGPVQVATCRACAETSWWVDGTLIHPLTSSAPLPNADLSDAVRKAYLEAAAILPYSSRGSAGLLRLGIQMMCNELLGEEAHDNLNTAIGLPVDRGLDVRIQQALDIVRVVGNNAVHPGQIAVDDSPAIAAELFGLVNLIADDRISRPKQIAALYERLPEGARAAIERRDGGDAV